MVWSFAEIQRLKMGYNGTMCCIDHAKNWIPTPCLLPAGTSFVGKTGCKIGLLLFLSSLCVTDK